MDAETPPAKRLRVAIACNRCRKLKVKCSGDFPCTRCEKLGVRCIFATETEPISQREIPYHNVSQNGSDGNHVSDDNLVSNGHFLKDDNEILSCVSQWRVHTRNQLLLIRELCISNLNHLPVQKRSVKIPRIQNYGWNMSGVHYLEKPPFPDRPDFDFSYIYGELMDYFFEEVNPLFNILSKEFQVFFQSNYNQFMQALLHPSLKTKNDLNLHSATLYVVFAIAIRFTEFTRPEGPRKLRLELETKCFSFALQVIETLSIEYFCLELVQCWLLVILYLRVTYSQRSLMKALDLANCMAKNMGLNESRVMKTKAGSTKQKAMQLFWTVYTYDQIFSVQLGRPSFWRNEEITVPFPDEKDLSWGQDGEPSKPLAMFRIGVVAHDTQKLRWRSTDESFAAATAEKLSSTYEWLLKHGLINLENNSSSLLSDQVAFHFYDVAFAFHSPILFTHLGKGNPSRALSTEAICQYMNEVLILTQKYMGKNRPPWYNTLSLLFCVGTYALVLINSAYGGSSLREMCVSALKMLRTIGFYKTEDGEPLFPMANECVGAISRGIITTKLRFQQEADFMLSVDLGDVNAYLNEYNFGLLGRFQDYSRDELPKLEEYNTESAGSGEIQQGGIEMKDPTRSTDPLSVEEMIRQLTCGTWLDSIGADLIEDTLINFPGYIGPEE